MRGPGPTLIHGNDQGTATNAKTGNPTTNDHLVPFTGGGTDLDDQSDVENDTPESDGPLSAQLVGHGSTTEGTDQGTDREQTDNETGTDIAEGVRAIGTHFTIAFLVVLHFLETGDLTGIITEEQTTDGDESTHDEGAQGEPGDRGVNAGHHGLLGRGIVLRGDRLDGLPVMGSRFNSHVGRPSTRPIQLNQVGVYKTREGKRKKREESEVKEKKGRGRTGEDGPLYKAPEEAISGRGEKRPKQKSPRGAVIKSGRFRAGDGG